jgi:hypothetical protein
VNDIWVVEYKLETTQGTFWNRYEQPQNSLEGAEVLERMFHVHFGDMKTRICHYVLEAVTA